MPSSVALTLGTRRRVEDNEVQFLVKWANYTEEENSAPPHLHVFVHAPPR